MHKFLLLLLFAALCMRLPLSAQGLEWAGHFTAFGSQDGSSPTVSHVDAAGTMFTAGYFSKLSGPVELDPGTDSFFLNTATHSVYLQKLDTDGQLVWAKEIIRADSDSGSKFIKALAVDQYGYIYTTGYIEGTFDFDPGPNIFNLGTWFTRGTFFVQKLDASGNLVWAKRWGNNPFDADVAYDIEVDDLGNILIAGVFSSTIDFDPGPDTKSLSSVGASNTFILKLKPSGELDWVKQIINPDYPVASEGRNSARFLCVDQDANVYVAGNFYSKTDFDPGPDSLLLTGTMVESGYILKLNAQGKLLWVHSLLGEITFNCFTIDPAGNVFSNCLAWGTFDVDPGAGTYLVASNGNTPASFLLKWTADGAFAWLNNVSNMHAIAAAPNGNLSSIGLMLTTQSINPANDCQFIYSPPNYSRRYYIRTLDTAGKCLWTRMIDVHDDAQEGFIGIDASENIYVRGRFLGTADFDPNLGGETLLTTNYPALSDIFVLKMRQKLKIEGTVFYDRDGNLVQDASDPGIPDVVIQVRHRDTYLSTDTAGYFRSYANIQNDTLSPELKSPNWSVIPQYIVPGLAPKKLNFAVSISNGFRDIAVQAVQSTPFRRGFENDIWLYVSNLGVEATDSFSLNFRVSTQSVPVPLSLVWIDPAPTTQINDQISWHLPGLNLFETRKFRIRLHTPWDATLNSPVVLTAGAILDNDADLSNNNAEIKTLITGSFDPNDKQVFPTKLLPDQLDSARLQYLIRFQNTGNAAAQFVVIRDTLPASLDIASLQMLGASHPYTWRLYGAGILELRFDMIHLPDSSSDEVGSHGFAAFSVRPKRNLTEGDAIHNRAGIYFDYNAPIITLSAVVQIVETSKVLESGTSDWGEFGLMPNPVGRYAPITVDLPQALGSRQGVDIVVSDVQGRIMQKMTSEAGHRRVVLSGLAQGAYFVQVRMGQGVRSKLLIVE